MRVFKINDKTLDVMGQGCSDSYNSGLCNYDCKKVVWEGNKSTAKGCRRCELGTAFVSTKK